MPAEKKRFSPEDDESNWGGNFIWRNQGGCRLVKQRLEEEMIILIDDRHTNGSSRERAGGADTAKPRAHDQHMEDVGDYSACDR